MAPKRVGTRRNYEGVHFDLFLDSERVKKFVKIIICEIAVLKLIVSVSSVTFLIV